MILWKTRVSDLIVVFDKVSADASSNSEARTEVSGLVDSDNRDLDRMIGTIAASTPVCDSREDVTGFGWTSCQTMTS